MVAKVNVLVCPPLLGFGRGYLGGHLDSEQYGHHKSMLGGWIMVAKVNVISLSTTFGPVKSLFGWFFYK